MEESRNRRSRREQGAEEEPQVYTVQKDLTGWRFSRRDFLAAAGAAAAAAVMGAAAGCGAPTPAEICADARAHIDSVWALVLQRDFFR